MTYPLILFDLGDTIMSEETAWFISGG